MQHFYSEASMTGFKLQKKPPAFKKREHPALQNMKLLNFSFLVGHF